ncbi:prepilin peptidase [Aeromicrobium sp. 179-A 4D2 NHS]|uniref:prepilin peptidase n=1 Tax=Aeromicrobium sp. 179-A 4D2 NHS TaxID=3142375 RepID=UPI00399FA83A
MALVPASDTTDGDLEPELVEVRDLYSQQSKMLALMVVLGLGAAVAVFETLAPQMGVWGAAAAAVFALPLPVLAWTDLRTLRLPNKILGPTAVAWFTISMVAVVAGSLNGADLLTGVLTGLGLGVLMFVIAVVSNGLGMGDVKFVALAGAAIGTFDPLAAVIATMILPPVLAVLGVIPLLVKFAVVQGRNPDSAKKMGQFKFAYGPYLVLGALGGLLFAPVLTGLLL